MTVARRLSFSAAAKELFISQSAVSRQIQTMEQEVGTLFFIRDGNAIRLTLAGQILREELEQTQKEFDALREQLKLLGQGKAGIFRFGLMDNQTLVSPIEQALQALQTGSRQITVERMARKQLYHELREGRLDAACAMAGDEGDFSALNSVVIRREKTCVAAARRLGFGEVTSAEEVIERCRALHVPLVALDESLADKPLRRGAATGRKAAFDPAIDISAMKLSVLEPTVAGGFAVTCVNESNRLSSDGQVELIELPFCPREDKLLLWPKEPENPLIDEFLNFIRTAGDIEW